jgi:hypothetical protein
MKRENPVDLYDNVYSGFGSDAEAAVRCCASMTLPVVQPKFPNVGTTHGNSSMKLSY